MDIIKKIKNNEMHTEISIKIIENNYFFRASDIGLILGINNINKNIKDYNKKEKNIIKTETKGGIQSVNYLSELGLYKILYTTNNPLSEEFINWSSEKIKEIVQKDEKLIEDIPNPTISISNISTQTDFFDDNEENIKLTKSLIFKDNELIIKFNTFIEECCMIRNDIEDSTVNLVGQYRIWSKNASKEVYHALLDYLKTNFKPVRLKIQNKNQVINGYAGIKLKNIEYKKKLLVPNDIETFIFHSCYFSPDGKVLVSQLLEEFQNWKKNLKKDLLEDDEKNIKNYLKDSCYVLYGTIWNNGNGSGYYGLSLNSNKLNYKKTSSTGKKVEKRDFQTNELITNYETIAKAAETENISAAKMSRSIKNKIAFNDDYYFITVSN